MNYTENKLNGQLYTSETVVRKENYYECQEKNEGDFKLQVRLHDILKNFHSFQFNLPLFTNFNFIKYLSLLIM